MTITASVQRQFFGDDLPIVPSPIHRKQVIRLPASTSAAAVAASSSAASTRKGSPWTDEEHERFLTGLEMFPRGPWKLIAQVVATRTTRQTMTHAQKYRQRIARHSKQSEAVAGDEILEPPPLEETVGSQPTKRKRKAPNDGTNAASSITRRRMTRRKRASQAEVVLESGPSMDEPTPELVAMEWLLAVHPVDWDPDAKTDNVRYDSMLLV